MYKTAVIVLHYGSVDDTKECIASLLKGTDAKYTDIIIVSNSSLFPRIKKRIEKKSIIATATINIFFCFLKKSIVYSISKNVS